MADDEDFNYTIMEKTDCISRPFEVNDPPVELRWKNKHKKRNKGETAVRTSKKEYEETQAAADDDDEQSFSDTDDDNYVETPMPIEANNPQCYTHASTRRHDTFKPTATVKSREYHTQYNFTYLKKPMTQSKKKTSNLPTQAISASSQARKNDRALSTESEVDMPHSVQSKCDSKVTRVPNPPKLHGWLKKEERKEHGSQASSSSSMSSVSQYTSQSTILNIKERKKMKAEVYGVLHYPHEDLKKIILDLNSQKMRANKHDLSVLQCAKETAETAAKHDVIENALSKQSNGLVQQFFSGKAPLSHQVLEELDALLEQILEYVKENLAKYTILYEKKKNEIKREVLSLLLTDSSLSSKILGDTVQRKHKYLQRISEICKEWCSGACTRLHQNKIALEEEEKEMQRQNRIDWKKILLRYPRERAFNDTEDVDGNFTRAKAGHWLVNCLLGPNDSKTFEETNREKMSKGIFLHKAVIKEAAKRQETNDRSKDLEVHKQSN